MNGKIVFSASTKRISEKEYSSYKSELNQFSLLMSINGTIGSLAFYNGEKILLGKSACYLNPLEDVSDRQFVYYLLSSDEIQNHFISALTGTTIKNLSLASIRKTKLRLPILKEQKKIASFLVSIDEKINNSDSQIQNTRQYKQALLQQLFN